MFESGINTDRFRNGQVGSSNYGWDKISSKNLVLLIVLASINKTLLLFKNLYHTYWDLNQDISNESFRTKLINILMGFIGDISSSIFYLVYFNSFFKSNVYVYMLHDVFMEQNYDFLSDEIVENEQNKNDPLRINLQTLETLQDIVRKCNAGNLKTNDENYKELKKYEPLFCLDKDRDSSNYYQFIYVGEYVSLTGLQLAYEQIEWIYREFEKSYKGNDQDKINILNVLDKIRMNFYLLKSNKLLKTEDQEVVIDERDNQDDDHSLRFIDAGISTSKFLKDYPIDNIMITDRDYDLVFCMNIPKGIGQFREKLILSAQKIILLKRLIDQCNDIIEEKPFNISDFLYHWNGDGLLCFGSDPNLKENLKNRLIEDIRKVTDLISMNSKQEQLFHLRGCNHSTYFDQVDKKGIYELYYSNSVKYPHIMDRDFKLVKDQLEGIFTVMGCVTLNKENDVSRVFESNPSDELLIAIQDMPERIFDNMNSINEGKIKSKNKTSVKKKTSDTGNISISKKGMNHKPVFDAKSAEETVLIGFTPKDKLSFTNSSYFLVQRQCLFLFKELLFHLKRMIGDPKTREDYLPYNGSLSPDNEIDFTELNNRLLLHKPNKYLLDLNKIYNGKLYQLIYIGDRKDSKEKIGNLESLRHQIDGLTDAWGLIGSGSNLANERDYKTLLCLIHGVSREIRRELVKKNDEESSLKESDDMQFIGDDKTLSHEGLLRIQEVKDTYERNVKMNRLLPTSQRILLSEDTERYRLLVNSLPLGGDDLTRFEINIAFLKSRIDIIRNSGDSKFHLDQHVASKSLLFSGDDSYMVKNMELYNAKVSDLSVMLNEMYTRYVTCIKDLKGFKSFPDEALEFQEFQESYGDMIKLTIDERNELDLYYKNVDSDTRLKSGSDMDPEEKITFKQYDLMTSRFALDMHEVASHEKIFMNMHSMIDPNNSNLMDSLSTLDQ